MIMTNPNNMLKHTNEADAETIMTKFFEYRDDNDLDGLVSWHLGEQAVLMMGGDDAFIKHCSQTEDYSANTDGIHYEFSAFNMEETDGIAFIARDDFKYAKPTLIDTVFEGMIESGFKGYMPTKDEVEKFLSEDMYNGRTNQAGLSIVMWNIEQIVSQLKTEFIDFLPSLN